jgi:hypothetical protein
VRRISTLTRRRRPWTTCIAKIDPRIARFCNTWSIGLTPKDPGLTFVCNGMLCSFLFGYEAHKSEPSGVILAGVDHEPSTRPCTRPARKSEQTAGSLVWLLASRALLYVLEVEAEDVTQRVVFAVKLTEVSPLTWAYFF